MSKPKMQLVVDLSGVADADDAAIAIGAYAKKFSGTRLRIEIGGVWNTSPDKARADLEHALKLEHRINTMRGKTR